VTKVEISQPLLSIVTGPGGLIISKQQRRKILLK